VNRFLTIRTISKGKSLGRPPVSDEILEDLKEMVEKTLQISIACLSQHDNVKITRKGGAGLQCDNNLAGKIQREWTLYGFKPLLVFSRLRQRCYATGRCMVGCLQVFMF
jgi:hypothetical protein